MRAENAPTTSSRSRAGSTSTSSWTSGNSRAKPSTSSGVYVEPPPTTAIFILVTPVRVTQPVHRYRGVRVGRVDLGVGTRPAGRVSGDHGEPRLGQPAQHLGRGRLGQPGQLPQVVTGEGALVQQVAERRALVHRAQQLRRAGQPRHGTPSVRQI